jgi:hypothetical protein
MFYQSYVEFAIIIIAPMNKVLINYKIMFLMNN